MKASIPTKWGNYGGSWGAGQYIQDGNNVFMFGLVKFKGIKLKEGIVIARLPFKARPKFRKVFNVCANEYNARIDIHENGNIVYTVMNSKAATKTRRWNWISLSGIVYNINDTIEITTHKLFPTYNSGSGQTLSSGLVKSIPNFVAGENKPKNLVINETLNGNMSVSLWVKAQPIGRQNPFDFGYGGEGTLTIERNGALSFYWGPRGGYRSPYQYFGGNRIEWNKWAHIVIVRDIKKRKLHLYLNGRRVKSAACKFGSAGSSGFKKFGYGYVNAFKGEMKDFRVYTRALAQSDVTALINVAKGVSINYGPPSLTATDQLVTMSGVCAIKKSTHKYIGNIPEEFRPNRNLHFWTNQNIRAAHIEITQNGDMYAHSFEQGQGFLTLDGISYTRNKSFK